MSLLYFVVGIVASVVISMLLVLKSKKNIKHFIKNEKSVIKGIIMVVVLIPFIAFVIEEAFGEPTAFNYAEAYAGLDYGKKRLPMCDPGGNNDRLVSNVGFLLNVLQTEDKKLDLNAKYTHHSCAYNDDFWDYDALGFELVYRIDFK